MHSKLKPLHLILALALATLITYWFNDSTQNNLQQDELSLKTKRNISAVITGAEFFQYSDSGLLSASIQSTKATHFKDQNRIDFLAPDIAVFSVEGNLSTQVKASQAALTLDTKVLTLSGGVEMRQMSSLGEIDTTLLTSTLTYDQPENFISTDQAVTISRGNAEIHAIGLEAQLDQKRMTLLAEVRGRYAPD